MGMREVGREESCGFSLRGAVGRWPGGDGGAGAVDPRVEKREGEGRVPGLVTAGGPGTRRPELRRDGRRRGPARRGHPPPAAAGRPAPGNPGNQSRRPSLDPGEGEGLLLRDCTWEALDGLGDLGSGEPHPGIGTCLGRPEESGLCVVARVPRWPRGRHGSWVMSPASPRLGLMRGLIGAGSVSRRRQPAGR